ncbi:glycosyltransferase family 2 protein [Lacinutrix venerupis]|uniref:Glycosyltransferase 2-like domain-containing protein n=1 Tax=Lacinutrix venerupis TaxID=1486034 RepID=A0AAC9LMB0_9FLAO|nr:glycosyltransferase family 2 protein [Lacinutrix venerupis]APY00734.1 hypothetical protein BWR22_10555 [Lacinutrix venerupis]
MKPLVSIIIPTYRRAHLITGALDSIIAQCFKNWECIIVDDGSDELTIKTLKKFIKKDSRIKLLSRLNNTLKGPSACRNLGLRNAKGKYIQFFDDDDVMYYNLLSDKIEIMEKNNLDVLVSPMDFFSVDKNKTLFKNKVAAKDTTKAYLLGEISWYVSGPLWLKSFLTENFDEFVQTLDDWDFNLRNIYRKPKIGYTANSYQRYNLYEKGNTLSTLAQKGDEKQINSVYYVYSKHFLLLKESKKLTKDIYIRFYKLLTPLLRESLIIKKPVSNKIFNFLLQNIKIFIIPKFIKIYTGFYFYKFFNKGYRLVKF